jgi:hypothetical protein
LSDELIETALRLESLEQWTPFVAEDRAIYRVSEQKRDAAFSSFERGHQPIHTGFRNPRVRGRKSGSGNVLLGEHQRFAGNPHHALIRAAAHGWRQPALRLGGDVNADHGEVSTS